MFRFRRELLATLLVLVPTLLLAAPSASAASASSERPAARVFLDYVRERSASSCISAEQLAGAVEARLARQVFSAREQADLVIELHARRTARRFVIEMALFDRADAPLGRRRLVTAARHCSALDDSLALIVSLAADLPPPVAPEPAPDVSASTSDVRPLETPITIPAETAAPRLALVLEPRLGLAALAGPVPGVSAGLQLGILLRPGHFWPLALRGAAWLPRTRQSGPGRGARFALRSLELGVCPWEGTFGDSSVLACGRQWFGHVEARGFGFDQDQSRSSWLASLGVGLELRHAFGPMVVSAGGELLAPLLRRRYFFTDVSDITTLHDDPWLYGLLELGVGVEF